MYAVATMLRSIWARIWHDQGLAAIGGAAPVRVPAREDVYRTQVMEWAGHDVDVLQRIYNLVGHEDACASLLC